MVYCYAVVGIPGFVGRLDDGLKLQGLRPSAAGFLEDLSTRLRPVAPELNGPSSVGTWRRP